MVEVYAELLRGPGSPVYLIGEEIECEITFRNLSDELGNVGPTKTLAWACAQISCQCSINESKVVMPKSKLSAKESELDKGGTSFLPNKGEHGIIVFSSVPKILFCDLVLEASSSKSFIYKEKIGYELPPSYRGQFIKYSYKLTIGTQQLNCSTKLLRIPFRVIAIKDFDKHLAKYKSDNKISQTHDDHDENEAKKDPFYLVEKNKEANLEFILEILQEITAKRGLHSFSITNAAGKIVKLSLYKLDYRIGEDIIGVLDFSDSDVTCVEYVVSLHSEERIDEECRKKANQGSHIESHSYHKEFCLFIKNTCFTLHVPVTAAPSFDSDIVSVQWRLHFDFMISTSKVPNLELSEDPNMDSSWKPPASINGEKLSWTLPINIHPTSPLLLSNVSSLTDSSVLIL